MPRGYGMSAGQRRMAGRISHGRRDRLDELETWLKADESHRTAYTYLYAQVHERTDGRSAPQFYIDLLTKARRYGELTPNQLAAVLRGIERDAERAAAREAERAALVDAPALVAGRRTVTGEIVSCRWRDGRFPGYKIVVREADGNKVWGSLAQSLDPELNPRLNDEGIDTYEGLVGRTVTMTATVTRSDEDEHFGFFKRPAGAVYVSATPAATVRLP